MKVCVVGLWHLGSVSAGCLAALGFSVTGLDPDEAAVAILSTGRAPLYEPGLDNLIQQGIARGRLRFTRDTADALRGVAVVWITYDTPVDDDDQADVGFVTERIERVFPFLEDGTVVLVSSQLPVGSTRRLARRFQVVANGRRCYFAYSPENLRLGQAIGLFSSPDRIVAGVDDSETRTRLAPLLESISPNLLWTSIESAEMIKHAINAFLATSIVFANEIAAVCESVGADAREVARGLKTDARVGPGAYVAPGGPFAGGTLARDIAFLSAIGKKRGINLPLLGAVRPSNDGHRKWTQSRIRDFLPDLAGRSVTILGLTYKPETDTLRGSAAIELARWLIGEGAEVKAYDPRAISLPDDLASQIVLAPSIEAALDGASATVLSIDASEFRRIDWRTAVGRMALPVLIDPIGIARESVAGLHQVRYASVGFISDDRQGQTA